MLCFRYMCLICNIIRQHFQFWQALLNTQGYELYDGRSHPFSEDQVDTIAVHSEHRELEQLSFFVLRSCFVKYAVSSVHSAKLFRKEKKFCIQLFTNLLIRSKKFTA